MNRLLLGGVASALLLLGLLGGRLDASSLDASSLAAHTADSGHGCPTNLLRLGANPVARASDAALRAERKSDRSQVTGAAIANRRFDRSPQVVTRCGRRVAAQSVVVTIYRRAYQSGRNKSASLSHGTVVVGRFRSGWRVWDVLH